MILAFAPFLRPALWAPGAVLLALSMAGPVSAQSAQRVENGARFGGWTVACEAIAVNETICVLTQRLVAAEGDRFLTELLAFNDAEAPQAYLAARVPLGVHFPGGFALQPEGAEAALGFDWQNCSAQLCEALLVLDADTLALLETGDGALAGYVPRPGAEPLVFRVDTAGLSEGLSVLAQALGQPGIAAGGEAE